MIDPFVEICSGPVPHLIAEPTCERVTIEERLNVPAQQGFGIVGERPVEFVVFSWIKLRVHRDAEVVATE